MNKQTASTSAFGSLTKRDLHIHTPYCNHASGEMEKFVQAGIDAGLEEIGFLEHVEVGGPLERRHWLLDEDIPEYWRIGRALREKYQDRIRVSVGLEMGINPDLVEGLLEIKNSLPWDRIGLSCHFLPHNGGILNICSRSSMSVLKNSDHKELQLTYYRILRDHIQIFKPDFICHIDVPRKFMTDLSGDPEIFSVIRDVLAEMAKAGTALEVNTSGYEWFGGPYPGPEILKTARSLGLKLVLNSDSHDPSHVTRHFDRAVDYLADILETPKNLF